MAERDEVGRFLAPHDGCQLCDCQGVAFTPCLRIIRGIGSVIVLPSSGDEVVSEWRNVYPACCGGFTARGLLTVYINHGWSSLVIQVCQFGTSTIISQLGSHWAS